MLDVDSPQVKLITEHNRAGREIDVPLGTRGVLDGIEWEAIGYLRRSENKAYGWEEYLLFNPYYGYRWLVNVRDGWSLGELLTVTPRFQSFDTLQVGGETYGRFFSNGRAQVDYVLGEFYWRVSVGEEVKTSDWVRPGVMLSREESGNEISWTLSRWLPPGEISGAFGVSPDYVWPPLPHQPSPHGAWLKSGFKIFGIAFAFLFLIAFVFGGSESAISGNFPIASDGREQSATLGPITLSRPYERVQVAAEVPVLENGWVDLDYSLVDRRTQQVFEGYGAAERYAGRDSDGAWTEGSRRSTISIASVPAGTYDLVIDYKGNRWTESPIANGFDWSWMTASSSPQLNIEVSHGVLYISNLLIAWVLAALPLAFALWRHLNFEKARREESDFSLGSDE